MALNKFMHERNPYKNRRPDFKALAVKYEKFRQVATADLRGLITLDFKKPECLQALSWALLKEHHDLDVDIPSDRLIPTIPLRLNYILWLEDLLERKEDGVCGIDVGTGATCVYPLLGAKKNRWNFLATESNEMSFSYAKHNVERNNLQDNITVVKVEPKEILAAPLESRGSDKYDFCMCNPPFFSNNLEAWGMTSSRSDDRPEPKSVSTANTSESIFPGGEVEFVRHMIADSLHLKDRVRIYTTMLGKKTSVSILKEDLRRNKVTHVGTTEFCQGRTMRWGLAWTFDETVKFPKSSKSQSRGNKPLTYQVPTKLECCPDVTYSVQGVSQKLQSLFDELQVTYKSTLKLNSKWQWKITAFENTWSHQRRKRRQDKCKKGAKSETVGKNKNVAEDSTSDSKVQQELSESTTDFKVPEEVFKPAQTGDGSAPCEKNVDKSGKRAHSADSDVTEGGDPCTKRLKLDSEKISEPIDSSTASLETDCQNQDLTEQLKETETNKLNSNDSGICVDNEKTDANVSKNGTKIIQSHSLKPEVDSVKSEVGSDAKECLLSCDVSVHKEMSGVVIQMEWIQGSARDSMQQVLQYIKNRIK